MWWQMSGNENDGGVYTDGALCACISCGVLSAKCGNCAGPKHASANEASHAMASIEWHVLCLSFIEYERRLW